MSLCQKDNCYFPLNDGHGHSCSRGEKVGGRIEQMAGGNCLQVERVEKVDGRCLKVDCSYLRVEKVDYWRFLLELRLYSSLLVKSLVTQEQS